MYLLSPESPILGLIDISAIAVARLNHSAIAAVLRAAWMGFVGLVVILTQDYSVRAIVKFLFRHWVLHREMGEPKLPQGRLGAQRSSDSVKASLDNLILALPILSIISGLGQMLIPLLEVVG